jgi:4-hydroxy-4-methyl-2-oxoglutarate aldolase
MSVFNMAEFARFGVATVYEASGQQGLIDLPLIQIIPGTRVAGPARTVRCGQNDNLMMHAALAETQPGEVLVLTMPEPMPVALVGDLLATQAKVRQAAALLVDAAVRDVDELRAIGLPVWARYIRARAATKAQVGAINETVTVGGVAIAPGDIVVLDGDGAVVVAASQADVILAAAQAREEKEARLRPQLQAGALTYDLHGLRAIVEGKSQP